MSKTISSFTLLGHTNPLTVAHTFLSAKTHIPVYDQSMCLPLRSFLGHKDANERHGETERGVTEDKKKHFSKKVVYFFLKPVLESK